MRKILFGLALLLFGMQGLAEDSDLADFVVGDYILVGRAMDSEATYTGRVSIYREKNQLLVRRVIGKSMIIGTAAFEKAAMAEREVLLMRFTENSQAYEQTCLVQGDLDNYARISCYLYFVNDKTESPGLEVMFIQHDVAN